MWAMNIWKSALYRKLLLKTRFRGYPKLTYFLYTSMHREQYEIENGFLLVLFDIGFLHSFSTLDFQIRLAKLLEASMQIERAMQGVIHHMNLTHPNPHAFVACI